jgi:hypothetical protein
MSYHEGFWLTVGAAASVIALATVVSFAEVLKARLAVYSTTRPDSSPDVDLWEWSHRLFVPAVRLGYGGISILLINGILQLAALAMALVSLADHNDDVPMIVPEIMAPLGIFLLLVSTWFTIQMHYYVRELNAWAEARRRTLERNLERYGEEHDGKPSPGSSGAPA